jgi:hypothetical protein
MAHTAVQAGRAPGAPAPGGPVADRRPADGRNATGRIRRRWLGLATTPGRMRLLLAGLIVGSLAWGALAAGTAARYAAAASSVGTTREPLSLDAQRIYARLSDANDAAATAFLTGGTEPAATRQRYLADIAAAGSGIEGATARGGAGSGAAAADLAVLARDLPRYAGEIETARADNRLGLPLGAAYLREASGLMRGTLLPRAQGLYAAENDALGRASAAATGLPLICVTAAAGLVAGFLLYRSARWLRGRTNRVLNAGLLAAALTGVISLAWLAVAYTGARSDVMHARAGGLATVQAAARVSIAAQEAHADESLTLIDNMGDDSYQQDFTAQQRTLGPGPGTLLGAAQQAAAGTPAAAAVTVAAQDARTWFAGHARVRSLDDNGNHATAVGLALGEGPGDAGTAFARMSDELTAAVSDDQAVFDTTARSAADAYGGLVPGLIAAAVFMAAACAWGLAPRLAEYR